MKSSLKLFAAGLLVWLPITSYGQQKKFHELYHPGDNLYVHAKAGLSLRQTPDSKAAVLTVVPFGEKVQVLPFTTQPAFTNSGIAGVWVNVTYGNFQGYQFSGYLSRYPTGTGDQPDTQLRSIFKVKKEVTTPPDNRNYNQYLELYFANGIVLVWSAPEGGNDVMITFPESVFTWQEAYLYARELRPDFFIDNKCQYSEGPLDCNGEYSHLTMKRTGAGDQFHPVAAIELQIGDAD